MIPIQYPETHFRYKIKQGRRHVFDEVRKRYIALTGEEWVRQNFIQYLLQVKKYPASLIGVEKEVVLGELSKRCDIVVHNRDMQPWMIVECKSIEVSINENVLEQLLRYNIAIPSDYLVLTNGIYSIGYYRAGGRAEVIKELPEYPG